MVHFPGLARTRLWIQRAVCRFYRHGFPHSEILGSKPACGSPRLIAASHVLHRLLAPRHPPYALSSLTIKLTRHVSAAKFLSRKFRADNSPFFFPQFALSSRTCGLKRFAFLSRPKSRRNAWRSCQLLQLSKSFGPGYRPERSAPGGTFENLRTEIKNPASSAGPIRLHTERKRLRAMLDSVLSGIRNWPHSSPERARSNSSSPDSGTSRTECSIAVS